MKSLSRPEVVDEILDRIGRLRPESPRQWGRMSPHQAVCHLTDSFRAVTGERPATSIGTWFHRTVMKWFALRAPLRWPKGVPTLPEVDQEKGGSAPSDFDKDIASLEGHVRSFSAVSGSASETLSHPLFGRMSLDDWMRWGYLHCDHHLRQFGE